MNNPLAAAFAVVLVTLCAGACAQGARAEDRTRHDGHAASGDAGGGSVRQDVHHLGHAIHQGVRATGHAIHQGVRATGHAVHQGVKATGHAIHEGIDKLTDK